MTNITILGSCRQTPISNHFHTTSIQEALTYPHYTKEILQEIKYLKHNDIPHEATKCIFRSGLLSHCSNGISNEYHSHLKREFEETDFFLIEVASRLYYKWQGYYLHHIAEDEQYGFYDRENIKYGELTDEEIEADLIDIRKELYPKKFLIISHLATYNHGKRYELIRSLEFICERLDIPFLDQSSFISKYGGSIVQDDKNHYTEYGHQVVGLELKNIISGSLSFPQQKRVYSVYDNDSLRVSAHGFHGFGDFLRGTIHLFQTSENSGVEPKVNYSNHILNQIFASNNVLSVDECRQVKYFFLFGATNVLDYTYIFSNLFYERPIDDNCRKWMIENCFQLRLSFKKKLDAFKEKISLKDGEYSVIHIRLADEEVFNNNRLNDMNILIETICKMNTTEKFILIASNTLYLPHINHPSVIKTGLQCGHLGTDTITLEQAEDTIIEFMIMSTSRHIYQLSVYDWGSGFSDIISSLFTIPITKYRI